MIRLIPENSGVKNSHQILSILADSSSHTILIQSASGTGLTNFANDFKTAISSLEKGEKALWIHCLREYLDTPFGVLSISLERLFKPSDFMDAVRHIDELARLRSNGTGQRMLCIVEEAHFLDAESAYVLTQLVQSSHLEMVLFVEGVHNQFPNLEPIGALGILPTVFLGQLSKEEISSEITKAFGVRPTPGSINVIHRLSGGHLDTVRRVIQRVEALELFEVFSGVGIVHAEELSKDRNILEYVWITLCELNESDRELLTVIAFFQQIDPALFTTEEALLVRALVAQGIVTVMPSKMLSLSASLFEDAIVMNLPVDQSRSLMTQWTDRWDRHTNDPWPALRWNQSLGEPVDEVSLTSACKTANDQANYASALEISTYTSESGNISIPRRIERLRALAGTGRLLEAFHGFSAIAREDLTDNERDHVTSSWLWVLFLGSTAGETYSETAEAWNRLLTQTEDVMIASRISARLRLSRLLGEYKHGTLSRSRLISFMSKDIPSDVLAVGSILGLESRLLNLDDICIQRARTTFQHLNSFSGCLRLVAAIAISQTLAEYTNLSSEYWTENVDTQSPARYVDAAIDSMYEGWAQDFGDHPQRSSAYFVFAALDFTASGNYQLANYCVTQAMLRNPDLIEDELYVRLVNKVDDILRSDPKLYAQNTQLRTIIQYRNEPEEFRNYLESMIDELDPEIALHGLWQIYRNHSGSRREDLGQVSKHGEKIYDALKSKRAYNHAQIVIGQKFRFITTHGESTKDYGESERALTNAAWASVLLCEEAGEEELIQARRYFYTTIRDHDNPVLVHDALELGGLSSRECEIASYLLEGLSNRQIAVTVDLSVRTVEGHVYRIFKKLGITDRVLFQNISVLNFSIL